MVMGSGWPVAVLHGQDPKKMHNRGMRKQFQIFLQAYYNPVVVFAFFVALFPFCSLIKPSKVFAFGAQNVCKLPIYTLSIQELMFLNITETYQFCLFLLNSVFTFRLGS